MRLTQYPLERSRQHRYGKLAQDDGNDDVTTLADDAVAREVHLEQTPVAGEEVRRQHEHRVAALRDALVDGLLEYAAREKIAVVDNGRDLVFVQLVEQVMTNPAAVGRVVADEDITLVNDLLQFDV